MVRLVLKYQPFYSARDFAAIAGIGLPKVYRLIDKKEIKKEDDGIPIEDLVNYLEERIEYYKHKRRILVSLDLLKQKHKSLVDYIYLKKVEKFKESELVRKLSLPWAGPDYDYQEKIKFFVRNGSGFDMVSGSIDKLLTSDHYYVCRKEIYKVIGENAMLNVSSILCSRVIERAPENLRKLKKKKIGMRNYWKFNAIFIEYLAYRIDKKKKQLMLRGRRVGSKSKQTIGRFGFDTEIPIPEVPGMIVEEKLKRYLVNKYDGIKDFFRRSLSDIIHKAGMSDQLIKLIKSNGVEHAYFPDGEIENLEVGLRKFFRNKSERQIRSRQKILQKKERSFFAVNPDLRKLLFKK